MTPPAHTTPPPPRITGRLFAVSRNIHRGGLVLVLCWGVACAVLARVTLSSTHLGDTIFGGLNKYHFEVVSPWVLGLALGVVACRYLWRRDAVLLWFFGIVALFFCRELHFAGTSTAVYVGVVTLLILALLQPNWTAPLMQTRHAITLFAMVFGCYLFAVSLDGRWWFDWSVQWKASSVLAEEAMELTGHILLFALACTLPRAVGPETSTDVPTPHPPLPMAPDTPPAIR